jgi:serine/threonine-protein kinase RsbW
MDDVVRLIIPAHPRHVRLVRLTAAGVAADAGLDVDDVEDLRIAVSELFALLVDEDGSDDEIEVVYRQLDRAVAVEGRRTVGIADGAAPKPDDLALDILRVIVDEHRFDADSTERRFELLKRAAPIGQD